MKIKIKQDFRDRSADLALRKKGETLDVSEQRANRLYGKSFKDLSEAQKQLTLLQMVKDANRLSGAMGQAARESNGWENVLGNLKESWNPLLAAVGKPVLQGAVVVIQHITSAISAFLRKNLPFCPQQPQHGQGADCL